MSKGSLAGVRYKDIQDIQLHNTHMHSANANSLRLAGNGIEWFDGGLALWWVRWSAQQMSQNFPNQHTFLISILFSFLYYFFFVSLL